MKRKFLMFETAEETAERMSELGSMGGAQNTPAQQEARERTLNRNGRPKGAKSKPKPINLPPWDDRVTMGHRYGEQPVREYQKEIYEMRLEGTRVDEIAASTGISPGQVRHILRTLAGRLTHLRECDLFRETWQ